MVKYILLIGLVISTLFSCTKDVKVDKKLKNKVDTALKTERFEHIKTLLIVHKDNLVYEYYREDITPETNNDIASAVKTVSALLIGIAIDKGYIKSIDDPFYSYFPEYENNIIDEGYKEISIRKIMSMTDGLDWDPKMDWKNITIDEVSNNPVLYSMNLNIKEELVNTYRYSSLNSQLLSALISKTTGVSMEEFAKENLFNHLNISDYEWSADKQGNTHGGFGLKINALEMSQIAMLLANKGKVNSTQVVSSSWIDEISTVNNDGGDSHPGKYGLHTWIEDSGDYYTYFAMGYGGQFISIIPELNLGWVIASDFDSHRDHHRLIVEEVILPALKK